MTKKQVCDLCSADDHSAHMPQYGGICVGCTCEYVPPALYDLSSICTEERFDAQQAAVVFNHNGWLTNGHFAVRESEVFEPENSLAAEKPVMIRDMLASRAKAFRVAAITIQQRIANLALFVADDGDIRLVAELYADIFGDVEVLYGDDDESTPLQNAPEPDDVTVVIMPVSRTIDEDDVEKIKYTLMATRLAQQGLASYVADIEARLAEVETISRRGDGVDGL